MCLFFPYGWFYFSVFLFILNVTVLQIEIWVSTNSGCLATGQVEPDLQEGRNEDRRYRDHPAQLPRHQVGDCRLDQNPSKQLSAV